ncbi:unnamed protein product [Anisakis simplex]|uniref:SHSP domain-containing protein n=1 Tax=Anisakis simplex TaxID=6269 RepID=A0A0M3KEE1_ANISI|nr:unnamed protein product [Anisakis simplex]
MSDSVFFQSEIGRSRPGSPQVVAGPGEIINTEHGFTIELDVRHFRPQDIKVTIRCNLEVSLTGNTLTVYGERLEDDPHSTQTLRRTFFRAYQVLFQGSRKGWKETEISVHVAPPEHRTASSVISIV